MKISLNWAFLLQKFAVNEVEINRKSNNDRYIKLTLPPLNLLSLSLSPQSIFLSHTHFNVNSVEILIFKSLSTTFHFSFQWFCNFKRSLSWTSKVKFKLKMNSWPCLRYKFERQFFLIISKYKFRWKIIQSRNYRVGDRFFL